MTETCIHKVIVCSQSARLRQEMKHRQYQRNDSVYHIKELNPSAVKALIEYIYMGIYKTAEYADFVVKCRAVDTASVTSSAIVETAL